MALPTPYGNGAAEEIAPGSADAAADASGFTNPNLHRRIAAPADAGGVTYRVRIQGLNSYRLEVTPSQTTDDDEIP